VAANTDGTVCDVGAIISYHHHDDFDTNTRFSNIKLNNCHVHNRQFDVVSINLVNTAANSGASVDLDGKPSVDICDYNDTRAKCTPYSHAIQRTDRNAECIANSRTVSRADDTVIECANNLTV
jgi:hypothetical protein